MNEDAKCDGVVKVWNDAHAAEMLEESQDVKRS